MLEHNREATLFMLTKYVALARKLTFARKVIERLKLNFKLVAG
jgi:hypothetical protein